MEVIDLMIDVDRAVCKLTEKQRTALSLWEQGYTQEEIAAMLGITHQKVSTRIQRAITRLRLEIT